ALDNELVRLLPLLAGLHTECGLSPRGLRVLETNRLPSLSTTVRVVHRVHHLTANGRANTEVTGASRLSPTDEAVVRVADRTDGRHAVLREEANLTGRELDLRTLAIERHVRRREARTADDCSLSFWSELDVVDG